MSSTLWVQITSVAYYLPYAIVVVFAVVKSRSSGRLFDLARELAASLFMLNSTLNPFLYCWKMREVREAVKDTIGQFKWFSS